LQRHPGIELRGSGLVTKFYHTDHHGSVVAMSAANGNPDTTEGPDEYDPFGNGAMSSTGQPFRYAGMYYDSETGLYQDRARMYSTSLGRFLQTDPVGYKDNLDLYTYVRNDPVNATDPTGKDCVSTNGTTTCTIDKTGSRIPDKFSFPTPKGWPAKMDNNSAFHHMYDEKVSASGSSSRAQGIRQGIVNDPTPGPDQKVASTSGAPNNASPQGRGLVGAVGSVVPSPVLSYTRKDSNGNTMVVNVTQPGHPLFPGYVARETDRDSNGGITVHNYGEGTSVLQSPYSPFAGMIDDVWQQQTQTIINDTPQ
jgi:RHS repeat-associated protein